MSTLDAPGLERSATIRLLAGVLGDGAELSLATTTELHGPLPRPGRHRAQWGEDLIDEVHRSGLTGRGGAGFPTGAKLSALRRSRRPQVVVNVMEGEPASRKDRVLAATVPHLVLDGAELVAEALGAKAVWVCVARDHANAGQALERAVAERIHMDEVSVPLVVERLPTHYVAGEESALVRWLDGGESRPTFRPSRPAIPSLGSRPALVHNAETLAHLALIARYGSEWFRQVGPPEAPGTALLTLSGAVEQPGVVEMALGTPVHTALSAAGRLGPLSGVLVGGYSGTWLHPDHLGVPLTPSSLSALGCGIGAGVLLALDASSCGIAETARIARWMAGESARQCGPCVFGLPAIADDLEQLARGHRADGVLRRLEGRLGQVGHRGACRHPDGVVRLVRSALRCFAHDVARHASGHPCRGITAASVLPFPSRGEDQWQ